MAVIKCPECKKAISEQAKNCPNCGYPLEKEKIKRQATKGFSGCLIIVFLIICVCSVIAFIASNKSDEIRLIDSPYKFLKEKKEKRGAIISQIEFYLATDRNCEKMKKLIKTRKINDDVLHYRAVFVDDEKYAIFSKYPITAEMFEEEQSKHIVASYSYTTQNGHEGFACEKK